MLITPDFVYVHSPKTGGTFVTRTVAELYSPGVALPAPIEHLARRMVGERWPHESARAARAYLRLFGHIDVRSHVHRPCSRIPEPFAGRPIVTTIRNVYARYVSVFEFGWWRRPDRPHVWMSQVRERFPHAPELTFEEFLLATSHMGAFSTLDDTRHGGLGHQTREFIRMFCRDARDVAHAAARARDEAEAAAVVRRSLLSVEFLHTESLNRDLAAYLRRFGHAEGALDAVVHAPVIRPAFGRQDRERPDWRAYYTPELAARVRSRDRVLFALFPEYDAALETSGNGTEDTSTALLGPSPGRWPPPTSATSAARLDRGT